MTNLNMRRVLKQPTLRMADGGQVSPWSLKGIANNIKAAVTKTPEQLAHDKAMAEYRAQSAAERAPAPVAPQPTAQPAAPMGNQTVIDSRMKAAGLRDGGELHLEDGGPIGVATSTPDMLKASAAAHSQQMAMYQRASATTNEMAATGGSPAVSPTPTVAAIQPAPAAVQSTRPAQPNSLISNPGNSLISNPGNSLISNPGYSMLSGPSRPAGLKHGGTLRTGMGGDVPGTGHGDKIPAKYEPGEFVVSNDMLDAQPELRGHLRGLREQVLAEKGMTPEQADAKALGNPKGLRAMNAGDWAKITQGELDAGKRGVQAMEESAVPRGAGGQAGRAAAIAEQTRLMQQPAGEALRYAPTPPTAPPTPTAASAAAPTPKPSIPGRIADAVTSPLKAAGQTIADKASAFAQAADAHIAKSPTLRMAGELAKEYPKTANVLGKLAKVGGNAANAMYSGDVGAGSTLDAAHVEALKKPWNPDTPAIVRPGEDQGKTLPAQASYSNEGRNHPGADPSRDFTNELSGRPGGRMPELPSDLRQGVVHKTVDAQGRVTYSGRNVGVNANGETQMVDGKGRDLKMLNGNNDNYAYSVDKNGKRDGALVSASGDGQVVSSMGGATLRGAFQGSNPLHEARMAAAQRGDLQAVHNSYLSQGDKGLNGLQDTRNAAPSVTVVGSRRSEEQPAGGGMVKLPGESRQDFATRVHAMQTAEQNKITIRGQDLTNDTQRVGQKMLHDSSMTGHDIAREGQTNQLRIAMAPAELAAKQRALAADIFKKAGGDHQKASEMAYGVGFSDLGKGFRESAAAQQTSKAAEETLAASQAKNMRDQFKGQFAHLPKEEAEYAEALASQVHDKLNNGEIVGAGENHSAKQQAILHTKAILGMQQKAKLRNSGMWNWIGGQDSMPTALDGSAMPEQAGIFGWNGGLRKGHNFEAGDYNYGDQELPANVGDDVISYLRDYNAAHTKARTKAK